MTYCIGYWLEKGLVLASDSRTNAGVDYISTYSKMHVFQPSPDRLFVLLAAGSLATTQAVVSWIRRDLDRPAELEKGGPKDLRHCDYLFEAAAYVIFHDATLRAIAERQPQQLQDLEDISGMGAKKLEAYGAEVLRVCAAPD